MDTKSELLVAIAALPAGDTRLPRLAAIIANQREEARALSMKLYRPGEAARALSCSRTTLWRLRKEGLLRGVSIRRGSVRFSEQELQNFIRGR